jgi:putative transcriptional regulator
MMPAHHVPEEYLLSYATGGLSEAEALFVATHAALCSTCRRRVRELESIAGALLERVPEAEVPSDLLAKTLAKLVNEPAPKPRPTPVPQDSILPRPLLHYTGPLEKIAWKKAFSSVWYVDLPIGIGDVPVRLRRFEGGVRIPQHTHRGAELEMVLSGGARDDRDGRVFERGDVAFNDENDVHSVSIEPDEPCIALGVHVARLKPVGFWSRMVFNYLGW